MRMKTCRGEILLLLMLLLLFLRALSIFLRQALLIQQNYRGSALHFTSI